MIEKLGLRSGHPAGERFVFEFDDEAAARAYFNCTPRDGFAVLRRWGCLEAVARIPGQADIVLSYAMLELMASSEPLRVDAVVRLFFADVSLPATILRTATERLETESRWGIVRLSDQRQVIMSSGMSGVLLAGVGIDETTSWKRPEFWNPSDLAEFERDWRRQLSVEGHVSMERTYQIRKPRTTEPWQRYTSNFRLLQGEDGLSYHLGVFVGRD